MVGVEGRVRDGHPFDDVVDLVGADGEIDRGRLDVGVAEDPLQLGDVGFAVGEVLRRAANSAV